jgi:hypothetical protein
MGRFPQSSESKGSQKWIQKLVNENSESLNFEIKKNLNLSSTTSIRWRSPLKNDKYAEYRDQDAIKRLEIKWKMALEDFWPQNGPQWDALGKSDNSYMFLVEAKSHISELISTMKAKNPDSRRRIRRSLEKTKQYLGINSDVDWSARFYQYTNRLAHLYFLRVKNQLPAYLVFVYFINDTDVMGPTSVSEWKGALSLLHSYLGIGRHKLQRYVAELFIDVNDLEK